MRKLVTLRTISNIRSIEGADAIECARIDGWDVVVKKGEFRAGDSCVYFEIDSFLPVRPEFEFLRKSSFRRMGETEGFRLKTVKLRGQISQGLALPPAVLGIDLSGVAKEEDLSEHLGVVKWDPPLPASLAGEMLGLFPSFIPKTDQERIQNLDLDALRDELYEVSVKLDGASMTVFANSRADREDFKSGVCSRNYALRETPAYVGWRIVREAGLLEKIAATGRNLALQGELVGPGIQGNPENLKAPGFFVFDIWDIDKQRYFTPGERRAFCAANGIEHVPILVQRGFASHPSKADPGDMKSVADIVSRNVRAEWQIGTDTAVDDILCLANGPSMRGDRREGIVFKSASGRTSFKAISNEYLLSEREENRPQPAASASRPRF
ncbi:MAG: RNA ligase (ATP) [Azospirillum sp.]|nr:RNA ligase (ATP) [Azospirillum sp.]